MLQEFRFPETGDDGREVYDVRFDAGQTEYDYEVLASDGQIISSDVERRDDDRNNGNNTDVAVSREESDRYRFGKSSRRIG